MSTSSIPGNCPSVSHNPRTRARLVGAACGPSRPTTRPALATPYDSIPARRAIVRRRALEETLAGLVEDRPAGEIPRPEVLAVFRESLAAGRAEIRRRFETGTGNQRNDGPAVLAATS